MNKIALEEHFALPETVGISARYAGGYWSEVNERLLDIHDQRLAAMDKAGIELAVLSLNTTVQNIPDTQKAIALARRANDFLAEQIAKRPARFAGFAALPMQDPAAAAQELRRCVRELGFKGALVNGFSQVGAAKRAVYYDLPQYLPFWEEVARLDVPFYLHPRDPLESQRAAYEGHPWLIGSPWSFAADTAVHAVRLMCSGLFDRFPTIQIILGHLGERIPYDLWRLDHRLRFVPNLPAKRAMQEYFRANFYLTTSGNFCTPSLQHAMRTAGAERVLFSVDYPFERNEQAAAWFDTAEIGEAERRRIGRDNALTLLKLRL